MIAALVVLLLAFMSSAMAGPRQTLMVTGIGEQRLISPDLTQFERPAEFKYHFPRIEGIDQIRLYFYKFSIAQDPFPVTGNCEDEFNLEGSNTRYMGPFCGDLTHQHMYVEPHPEDGASLTITINSNGEDTYWDIGAAIIESSSEFKAPQDCFQYFTNPNGVLSSCNFKNRQQLNNHNYTICVKKHPQFDQLELQTTGDPEDFILSGQPPVISPGPPYPNITNAQKGLECNKDYLEVTRTRYCGNWLDGKIIVSNDDPEVYRIRFVTDDYELGRDGIGEDFRNTGFNLRYDQTLNKL